MNSILKLSEDISDIFNHVIQTIKSDRYEDIDEVVNKQQVILSEIKKLRKKQIKLIRTNEVKTRTSALFFELLNETKNLLLFLINILKAHRDFVIYNDGFTSSVSIEKDSE